MTDIQLTLITGAVILVVAAATAIVALTLAAIRDDT